MSEMQRLLQDYRLTTAEILYHFPDYPDLLQQFVWQEYDIAPRFPVLNKFLTFWQHEIEGKLHSIRVCSAELIMPREYRFAKGEWLIQ